MWSTCSGVAVSPAMTLAGSPGMSRTMKNTTVATPNSVGMANVTRRSRNRINCASSVGTASARGVGVDRVEDTVHGSHRDTRDLLRGAHDVAGRPQEDLWGVVPDLLQCLAVRGIRLGRVL